MSQRQCPHCRSTQSRPLGDIERMKLKLPSFTILGYFKCSACGYVWEPPAPQWAVGIAWATAVGLLITAGFVSINFPDAILGWVTLAGLAFTVIVSLVKLTYRQPPS